MKTQAFFVRHAQSDTRVHDDLLRPLTEKGQRDCGLVTAFLRDQHIGVVASSPFRRAMDTVQGLARERGLAVLPVEGFAERRISRDWIPDFSGFAVRQWADFDYSLPDGESLRQVQARNLAALQGLLATHPGQNMAVGSHGTALCTLIHHHRPAFGWKDFERIAGLMPWLVCFSFEGTDCMDIWEKDLFTGVQRSIT